MSENRMNNITMAVNLNLSQALDMTYIYGRVSMIEGVAMKKKKVKLNKKQQQAVDLILSGVNVFLTGDAGTGKTTVVQQSVKALEKDEKNVLIAATTGVAADNIGMGAVTVHKAFGLLFFISRDVVSIIS